MPLDYVRCPIAVAEIALRAQARRLIATHGARITCAARRIAGTDGVALANAVRDTIADSELIPETWPLDELQNLLRLERRDVQVPGLIARLESLRREVLELSLLRSAAEDGLEA